MSKLAFLVPVKLTSSMLLIHEMGYRSRVGEVFRCLSTTSYSTEARQATLCRVCRKWTTEMSQAARFPSIHPLPASQVSLSVGASLPLAFKVFNLAYRSAPVSQNTYTHPHHLSHFTLATNLGTHRVQSTTASPSPTGSRNMASSVVSGKMPNPISSARASTHLQSFPLLSLFICRSQTIPSLHFTLPRT